MSDKIHIKSPGRLNLIGEHTDYNGGYVLPCAINLSVDLYFEKSKKESNVISDLGYSMKFDVKENYIKSEIHWENYVLGVVQELKKIKEKTHDVKEGFDNLEDEVECSVEFSVAVFFIYDIIAFIFKAIWWVLSILAEPFGNLLKELLGDYYDPLMYPFILLGHLYKFAITVFFKMLKFLSLIKMSEKIEVCK